MSGASRFQFNKERILALPASAAGTRATCHDTKTLGLQRRVTPAGAKTFSMYRRTKGGGPERVTLGRFPAMTEEQARKAAATVNSEIEHGANPAEVKRVLKAEPTLTEFFTEYGRWHGEKLAVWSNMQQRFRDYLQKPLGDQKLGSITRAMIARALSDVENAGKAPATVRLVRALASGIFGKAMVLKARQEAIANEFVFPGPGASGHMVEPKKAVIRVMERAGIPYGRNEPNGVTLHD